ncbi:outer membrane beta-barrel protein [uncultured Sunxiuqinia sp.]|uniref:outer membrane beta-barrel protein n=1 Tax=uncultured Sunxiuqinia sp. TaxID=1573825 RepID=UPI002AA7A54F|nr:outer membrane beta-barrel protein [uncultured Sunxiuqinia sp.]
MKRAVITTLLIFFFAVALVAQDTTRVGKVVEVKEGPGRTEVGLFRDRIYIDDNDDNDTTHIRFGKRNIEIIEREGQTNINMHRDRFWEDDDKDKDNWKHNNFDGHWAGFELGVNGFYGANYLGVDEFMELNQPKSIEVNINFLEYNIALKENRIGLVTGMGWSMNNYRFDNPLTIEKVNGMIEPKPIDPDGFDKSKLTVSYLTIPLLLEFQVPVNRRSNYLFVQGGVIGGLNIGSHTKYKTDHTKSKDRGSFNINPFKYSLAGRIGLKDISLFATYSLSTFFKENKGPELFPFSIGIGLVNF